MHSRVVFHLARALQEAGVATLRFNFRGVGRSAGHHDEGRGEVEDARAARAHLESLHPGLPLIIAGHSFGAWVGLRAGLDDAKVSMLVGVGVPLRYYAFDFLATARPRVLLVQGEEDAFGSGAEIIRLDASLGPRVETVVIPGADHFFAGHLDVLRALIQDRIPAAWQEPGR
jgi:alpha/beta superfamily hydrolase